MKYLKKFKENNEFDDTIENLCRKLNLSNYTINDVDGTVDVDGKVDISRCDLESIHIQFGTINGYFMCCDNKLTSLKGSPLKVYGSYWVEDNKLTTLEGITSELNMGSFSCKSNNLTTLKGGPKIVVGSYNCNENNLINLEGSPEKLGLSFYCFENPIHEIYKIFNIDNDVFNTHTYKRYQDSTDYNYLRGASIIKHRFQEACEEAGIKMPEYIHGYKYI